ncbi:redox-active disulfide protein 2 [Actinoplanes sp. NBRC 14428]|uniref:Small redox-active disulfide protein 2 n=1 Tax=Pseudosporangium ferrugineum TaxID=439699 RepID=A0A2T0RCY1_9ACTN|nr:thioredoxin family protein [Pseudosporangium ferrugineum]PRY19017.1 small redox-active disulfide protein 2 [Pseudosporangium ferrugineum]BCJ53463.1 redox-active disulfide protein 2 [Actinoplanes sp. NBRC 14428]
MLIKILGPGCANCHTLERLTHDAIADLNLTAEVSSVTDYPTIVGYGVMSTPALVVDDRVVLAGRIPTAAQLRDLLTTAAA